MARLVGLEACWEPEGTNSFRRWATTTVEGPPPQIGNRETSLNCWEMIMLAAYQADVVSWSWINQLYTASGQREIDRQKVPELLITADVQAYDPDDALGPKPNRGDLVFWGDGYHMALAAGSANAYGQQRVYSFWPPPDQTAQPGVVDCLKVLTVEALTVSMNFTFPPSLSCITRVQYPKVPAKFCEPPWQRGVAGLQLG